MNDLANNIIPVFNTSTWTVQPSETVVVNRTGSFVSCLDADREFQLGLNDQKQSQFERGLSLELDAEFSKITIFNPHSSAIKVTLGIGKGKVRDARLTLGGDPIAIKTPNDAPIEAKIIGQPLEIKPVSTITVKNEGAVLVQPVDGVAVPVRMLREQVRFQRTNSPERLTTWKSSSVKGPEPDILCRKHKRIVIAEAEPNRKKLILHNIGANPASITIVPHDGEHLNKYRDESYRLAPNATWEVETQEKIIAMALVDHTRLTAFEWVYAS